MPTLAIIIPTKNEDENLGNLLRDIKNQSLQPNEVIIADAQSTDRTCEIAEDFDAKVVDGGLPGPGRNRGAEAAKSDIFMFIDADARLFDTDFLKDAMHEFEERELGIAGCDLVPVTHRLFDRFGHRVYNWLVRRWEKKRPHAAGSFIMVRSSIHDRLNGFDEDILLAEDRDYTFRANKISKFGMLNEVEIGVSVRRFDKDGRLKTIIKYLAAELHYRLLGPIKHNYFNYGFGYEKKRSSTNE